MKNNSINSGVNCTVENCQYHAMNDKCTAEKIEVCNCVGCTTSADTFCKTYKEK